jgi:hypothetical protein
MTHTPDPKFTLPLLAILSLACSRVTFFFINDPEGPNLLIVVVLALPIFAIFSVALHFLRKIKISR